MSAERRTRMSPQVRRAQLVALGVAALADHPLDALDVDDLCAQAGVSRGLLFYYFDSKQGFRREVVRAARDDLLLAIEPQVHLPPMERLNTMLAALVEFVREHRGIYLSLVHTVCGGGGRDVRAVVEETEQIQTERVVAMFEESGIPPTRMLRLALRAWVAFAEQALVERELVPGPEGDARAAELLAFLRRSAAAVVEAAAERPPTDG